MDVGAAVAHAFDGQSPRIRAQRPYPYRTSFPLVELAVELAGGEPLSLIAKNVCRGQLDGPALRAKPEHVWHPRREIDVYELVLSSAGLGTPRWYGTAGSWLVLEKVVGSELWQVGDLALWEQAARWLRSMHEGLRDARTPSLLVHDERYLRTWLRRAREFTRDSVLDRVAARFDEVIERTLALPRGFVHGEFYASNVIVATTAAGVRVCPVDWEMAAVGPLVCDLAALTTGKWSDEAVRRLAAAYDGAAEPPETLLDALDVARLHLAIQWLGWSADWSPPPDHAQDWLGELGRLADKLEL